ncbi:MAG: hypothetical protein SFU99_22630 [Saprospiraceae bacterium]|nr:hypothetical protein [Saprospiraceae bacterium]
MDLDKLANEGFKKAFESIDKYGVKKGVDEMGLDGFISHCAKLAAMTGAVSGMGGAITMIVGIPADVINNVVQQFRVTLGVIYDRRGSYDIDFEEFMKIVGISIGVEVGVIMTRSVMVTIAEQLLVRMGARAAGRLIPFLGAAIGAGTNYLFITGIGESVKEMDL